jgi:dTDP-glucose 4,6-dehydratase
MKFIVTGGAGYIVSMVIRHLINDLGFDVVNLDRLTYAGNLESSGQISSSSLF